ncbi:hypothetical protein [Nitriliruptor alkaliphilus]|uniref:hypothetical protein n=1 Tax=Nitriliruptor alkaliphilus TaxID=427918 RepID=UPI000696E477|nr:hypothetical protein [Nitriliruptor alkaliphilus]
MGRKRLLTILAAVTTAIALQVGPAAAADDCLVLGEDVSLLELASLSETTCVVDSAGNLILGTLEDPAGTVEETVDETVDTVEKTTEKVTDAVTGGGATEPAEPSPEPESAPAPGGSSGGGGDGAPSTGGSNSGGSSGDVAASGGDVREPQAADPARERQLGALRAIRDDLAAGTSADRGIAGPVQPFGDLATTDDLSAPQVADAGEVVPGVSDGRGPKVAPASPSQEAVLATSSPMRDIAEAPLALQLLAAALVMGAATVWTIASRELGRGQTTTA